MKAAHIGYFNQESALIAGKSVFQLGLVSSPQELMTVCVVAEGFLACSSEPIVPANDIDTTYTKECCRQIFPDYYEFTKARYSLSSFTCLPVTTAVWKDTHPQCGRLGQGENSDRGFWHLRRQMFSALLMVAAGL